MVKRIYRKFHFLFVVVLIGSCKTVEKNISGIYESNAFTKQTLKLNTDNTFHIEAVPSSFNDGEFSSLLSSALIDPSLKKYLDMNGIWMRKGRNKIILQSQTDTLLYSFAQVRILTPKNLKMSSFTFLSTQGEMVHILYIRKYWPPQEVVVGPPQGTVSRAPRNFSLDATLQFATVFYFEKYLPFVFLGGQVENKDYIITLNLKNKRGYFSKNKFRINDSLLTDKKSEIFFTKNKNGR